VDGVSAAVAGDERLLLADGVALVRAEALHADRQRSRTLKRVSWVHISRLHDLPS
jgi:hypothetical protein